MPHPLILRLAEIVPRLRPALLHRVIDAYGLEDCAELVAQATPAQLSHVFDLDLWRPPRPGLDEQFDAERFGIWLEVLLESGADLTADKLAQLPSEQLVAGFAHHARVFDIAAVGTFETTDGEWLEYRVSGDGLAREIAGYHVVAKREDAWDAIAAVLLSLADRHPSRFGELMGAVRSISSSGHEPDGLHPLLESGDQMMFDVASERERRRDRHGFASPAQARAFLQMSRSVRPGVVSPPNPIARAYFRSIDTAPKPEESPAWREETDAEVARLLADASVLPLASPRGLLAGGQDASSVRLAHIHRHMQSALERDPAAYEERNAELTYLANVLMAGASIQSRPFTAKEAFDAAVAVCNLGLARSPALPDDRLIAQDLIGAFQVGWAALHDEVGMFAAKALIDVVARVQHAGGQVRSELETLRLAMTRQVQAGTPWRAEPSLDVIATLDQPAWAALVALIAECPAIHGALTASLERRTRTIDARAFRFIAGDADIALVRDFVRALPELLGCG